MGNSLNLTEINQEQALSLAKFFIRSNQNMLLMGQKGTGKSSIALQAIKECNLKVNYINLSVVEKSDILGFPQLFNNDEVVTYKSPVFLPTLKENEKPNSVIIFDEIDKCPPEVTSPLLEILQFKTINNKPINATACILTANLLTENTYSNIISSAILDRCSKYVLSFDFNKWLHWCKQNNIHDLITGFLINNQEFVCGKVDDSCYGSPSPRGWSYASDAIIKANKLKIVDTDTIIDIVSGFVGNQAGLKFKIWHEHYRRFENDIHSFLDSGSMVLDYNSLYATEKVSFIISLCHLAKLKTLEDSKNKRKLIHLDNLCKFFKFYGVAEELQLVGLTNCFDFDLITKHKLYTSKEFFNLFSNLTNALK